MCRHGGEPSPRQAIVVMSPRLGRLPSRRLACGLLVLEARDARSRLLGLAGLAALPAEVALHLPRCRSVHTFGMRFALDLAWLDDLGMVVRLDRAVPPCRIRACRRARSVLEGAEGALPTDISL
jgi:uncharacterized protein